MDIQWPLALFSLLAGCGGGLLAFIALGEVKGFGKKARFTASLVALIVIIVGGCCSVAHLGNPSNIMAAAANIGSFSGISMELIFLGVSVIVDLVYLIAVKRDAGASTAKAIAIIGGILGIILAFVTGNGYVMESQAAWNTVLLPLCYLVSGLVMGGALYGCLLLAKPDDSEAAQDATSPVAQVNTAVLVLAVIELVLFVAYDAFTGFAGDVVAFWVCAVVVGAVGTIVSTVAARRNTKAIYAATVCSLVGGLGIRAAMWIMGTGFLSMFTVIAARGVLGV